MQAQTAYLNPKLYNPATWKAKRYIVVFFTLDIAFLSTSIIASICISFYRPFLIFLFTIINGCLLVFSVYAFILFETSSNRLNIVLYFHFYRLLFFVFVLVFTAYEVGSIFQEAQGFVFSQLYLPPFLYFAVGLVYEMLSIALSLFLIALCYRLKKGRAQQQPPELPTFIGLDDDDPF